MDFLGNIKKQPPHCMELMMADSQNQYFPIKPVSTEVINFLTKFVQTVCEEYPNNPLPLLYSPHAMIAHLYHQIQRPDFSPTDNFHYLFEQTIVQTTFAFDAFRTLEQPADSLSLSEQFRSYLQLSSTPDKDYTFAIDFAVGLGIAGKKLFDYSSARKFLAYPHQDVSHDNRYDQLWDCYKQLAQLHGMTVLELANAVQDCLRKLSASIITKKPAVSNSQDDLLKTLQHEFMNEFITLKPNITADNIINTSSTAPLLHGIHTLGMLFNRVLQVFIDTLTSRDELFSLVKRMKFSSQQIGRFVPSARQITTAHDILTFDSTFLSTEINKNIQFISNTDDNYASLQHETLCNLTLKRWSDHDCQFSVSATEEFLQILVGYFTAIKSRIRPQTHHDFVKQLLNTCINSNLFSISLSEEAEALTIPLAPLILLLTIINTPHQFGARASRHWDLTQVLQNTPLASQTKTQQRFTVGLYLRLRTFFIKHCDLLEIDNLQKEAILQSWDRIFCSLTGYNPSFAIISDGKPNTFTQDVFALEQCLHHAYFEPICNQIYPQHPTVCHEEVFHWMQEHDKNPAFTTRSIDTAIQQNPLWINQYRELLSQPCRAAYDKFWNTCCNTLPLQDLLKNIPKYSYPEPVSFEDHANQFKPKLYIRVIFETYLRNYVIKEDTQRLAAIAHKLYPVVLKWKY